MLKGTQYTSAVLSNTGKAFATSADGTLREILEGQVLRAIELPGSVNGCALSRSGKLLLSVSWPDNIHHQATIVAIVASSQGCRPGKHVELLHCC